MSKTSRKINIALITTLLALALPLQVGAQELPSGPVPGTGQLFTLPTVPISNPAYEAKETGMSIFGYKVPISWDGLAIAIAKRFIEHMTVSTVNWINNGFDGNPGYVTDPKQYFTDIADGIAGEFIGSPDSKLNFLCSPFQAQVKLALRNNYIQSPTYACTLSRVVGNVQDFYDNFNNGGWDAWFAMTQNSASNPYGAYYQAEVDLNSQIARAVGLKNQELTINKGFLSWSDCLEKDPQTQKCKKYGPVKTPGVVIESQLENTLGSGLRQLELADEFDELTSALMGQLLSKTVFSVKGLFTGTNTKETPPSTNPPGSTTYPTPVSTAYPTPVTSTPTTPPGTTCTGGAPEIVQCERGKFGFMSPSDIVTFLRSTASSLNAAGVSGGPFGILKKTAGNNCNGYSCDIICNADSTGWDVLIDSEGAQTPAWNGPKPVPNSCEIQ